MFNFTCSFVVVVVVTVVTGEFELPRVAHVLLLLASADRHSFIFFKMLIAPVLWLLFGSSRFKSWFPCD